jgi:PPE-repeat protein
MIPPEINSGRMYSGPGAGPLLAAAEAWDVLAAELGFAATGYGSTLTELTGGPWRGPTSVAMTSAVTPYIDWLTTTSAQAEESANHARAAVAAYEAAFAMTVPPPVVAANRVLLAALVATNFFGQNTPAIMATEALYLEMWAQDAAAMYNYAGASALANQVTPFVAPPQTTDPDASGSQSAAVTNAAAAPAGQAATVAQNAIASVPSTTAQATASGASVSTATTTPTTLFAWLETMIYNAYSQFPTGGLGVGLTPGNLVTFVKQTLQAYFATGVSNFGLSMGQQLTFGQGTTAGSGGAYYATPEFAALTRGAGISAGVGQGRSIGGRLSVPGGWASEPTEAEIHPYGAKVAAFHGLELEADHEISELGGNPLKPVAAGHAPGAASAAVNGSTVTPPSNGVLGGVPMGGNPASRGGFDVRYGFRHAVIPRPPSAG